ncbi:hypothetical protein [Sporichthya sp.]|uniref:hypothetical protein n=1 Tax=Sporichthya sp. TaxID=65475 RepID=UPI00182AF1A2|nr:hypothetical protein [Sporichthya sp.]MBA3743261.1 hypothetical protein [Sporichthya sp.]
MDSLRRLAFAILSPALGRGRRARLADTYARRAGSETSTHPAARAQVVRSALLTGSGRLGLPTPRGRSETDRALAAMMPAARAAFVLLHLENLPAPKVAELLTQAGVPDAATAVGLAERTPLDPTALRALVVPGPARFGPRTVAVAAGVLVVAVAAPVIAVTTSGGDDTPAPVSNQTPVQPAQPNADAIAKAVRLDRDLTRILTRLDEELARADQDQAEIKRLRTLRAAVVAEQKRLGGSTP